MWRGKDWKFSYPKPDNCKDAKESENNSKASIQPNSEDQDLLASSSSKISVKDASLNMLDPIANPLVKQDVAVDKRENPSSKGNGILSSEGNDKPFRATQPEKTAQECETISDDTDGTSESEVMSTKLVNTYHDDNEPAAIPITILINGSSENQLMNVVTDVVDKPQDISKVLQNSGKTGSVAPSMAPLLLLLKQAVDGGSAVVMDGDSYYDADTVYAKTVAFSQSAPPGPVFRRPRKVTVQKCEEKKFGEPIAGKIVTAPEKSRRERKSGGYQMAKDFKDHLHVGTRGTLGVDELAKLLA